MVWIEGCQIEVKRYALLDTDFISKTHSVQDDGGNHLIDRVMELPGYEFFCHAQIVTELNRYNADAPIWLSEKIGAQKIKSYTDQEILESLSLVRGPLACATYTQMLKLACDAFSKDYFSEHYRVLEEADYTVISREDCVFIIAKQLPISRRRSAANTFVWSQIAKIQDFVRTVGMGNGIPIKIARNEKSRK